MEMEGRDKPLLEPLLTRRTSCRWEQDPCYPLTRPCCYTSCWKGKQSE